VTRIFFTGFALTDMKKSMSKTCQVACQTENLFKSLYFIYFIIYCDTLFDCDTLFEGSIIFFSTGRNI
jgi:hypothetical protein